MKTFSLLFASFILVLLSYSCQKDNNDPVTQDNSIKAYYQYEQFGMEKYHLICSTDTFKVGVGDTVKIKINNKSLNSTDLFYDNKNMNIINVGDSLYECVPQSINTSSIQFYGFSGSNSAKPDVSSIGFHIQSSSSSYYFYVDSNPQYIIDANDDATKQNISDEISSYGLSQGTLIFLTYNTCYGGDLTIRSLTSDAVTGSFAYPLSKKDTLLLGYNNQICKCTFSMVNIYQRNMKMDLTDVFKKKYPNKVNSVTQIMKVNLSGNSQDFIP